MPACENGSTCVRLLMTSISWRVTTCSTDFRFCSSPSGHCTNLVVGPAISKGWWFRTLSVSGLQLKAYWLKTGREVLVALLHSVSLCLLYSIETLSQGKLTPMHLLRICCHIQGLQVRLDPFRRRVHTALSRATADSLRCLCPCSLTATMTHLARLACAGTAVPFLPPPKSS